MKRAGLCVRYDCDNFGSMLQILATQKAINQAGWDYEIIRYDKRTPLFYLANVTRLFNYGELFYIIFRIINVNFYQLQLFGVSLNQKLFK